MKAIILLLVICSFAACTTRPLQTVTSVDLNRYAGTWYEIARLPNSFEKGLDCVTATYSLRSDGDIDVLNKGRTKEKTKEANGKAWVVSPGKLKVRFFWPFTGDYYIMALDENYHYALIGDPGREYLWILCREQTLAPAIYSELLSLAAREGFDTSQVYRTLQQCP